jgi:hypothetical protein
VLGCKQQQQPQIDSRAGALACTPQMERDYPICAAVLPGLRAVGQLQVSQ